ncbi:MAG TPA: hypothetical protein PK876_06655 [Elusimicrobiota bacterium]|nr:hypothetical protein [Elusimicrobiota bacterium]
MRRFLAVGVLLSGFAVDLMAQVYEVRIDAEGDAKASAEIRRCLKTAYGYYYDGKYFWAVEHWQRVLRTDPSQKTAQRWSSLLYDNCGVKLGRVDLRRLPTKERTLLGISPPRTEDEKLYLETLQAFLEEDYGAAWDGWMRLSRCPRYADEVQWLLWGPQAKYYQSSWEERRQTAARFRETYSSCFARRGGIVKKGGTSVFRRSGGAGPHLLSAVYAQTTPSFSGDGMTIYQERCEPSLDPLVGLDRPVLDRYRKALSFYCAGRWKEALAWFRSASSGPVPHLPSARSARRLSWLYPATERKMIVRVD